LVVYSIVTSSAGLFAKNGLESLWLGLGVGVGVNRVRFGAGVRVRVRARARARESWPEVVEGDADEEAALGSTHAVLPHRRIEHERCHAEGFSVAFDQAARLVLGLGPRSRRGSARSVLRLRGAGELLFVDDHLDLSLEYDEEGVGRVALFIVIMRAY
jgi:hypothetical protein